LIFRSPLPRPIWPTIMPPMPRAIAPPPTYWTVLAVGPAIMETIPTVMASIGRYISVWRKLSCVTSGISGGDSSRISPLGSSGGSDRSVRRTMTVLTGAAFRNPFRSRRAARLDR
jgi:hypothetical protein